MKLFELKNRNGLRVVFTDLGGRIISIQLPEKDTTVDIIAGAPNAHDYLLEDEYTGAICGRFANRISNASFYLDGANFQLTANEGKNQLHGGIQGFHKQYWRVEEIELEGFASAFELHYISKHLEEGFPGELWTSVIYALTEQNELLMQFMATCAAPTILNLTNHCYFNLAGKATIHQHYIQVFADSYTPFNQLNIPTGEIRSVENEFLDFRKPTLLADFLAVHAKGLDHNFVLEPNSGELKKAAKISLANSNRSVEISTTQPGVQIYTALHFHAGMKDKAGNPMLPFSGIAVEPQNFPDAPNHGNFPSAVLRPGEQYQQTIKYAFKF